jgi:hydroxypyruvate reductase
MSSPSSTCQRRDDALAIWNAGVAAVRADRLVRQALACEGRIITVTDTQGRQETLTIPVSGVLLAVGGGKAGAGMAAGLEQVLSAELRDRLTGWVNVPDDCVRPLDHVHLHGARPAGVNEPTEAGVAGAEQILKLVAGLTAADVCLVLLSGGASALLPAPARGVTLADKQSLTRQLMQAGVRIDELNCVRKQLSRIKGGRLARACRAGSLLALIISDVIGDRLDVIGSGPTVPDPTTAAEALDILERFRRRVEPPPAVLAYLRASADARAATDGAVMLPSALEVGPVGVSCAPRNMVIGSIDTAITAATREAQARGYRVISQGGQVAGVARDVGGELAELCLRLRQEPRPTCVLSGGEPVVHLVPTELPRRGGRNQELVLAAACRLLSEPQVAVEGVVLLSGGTDGEDGPTDAAGAWVDAAILESARRQGLDAERFLSINNAYPFFEQTGGLLRTGPTHTNVMDLRVALVGS